MIPIDNSSLFYVYDLKGKELYHSRRNETNVQALQEVVKNFGLFEEKKVVFMKDRFIDKSRDIDTFINNGYFALSRDNIEFLGMRYKND